MPKKKPADPTKDVLMNMKPLGPSSASIGLPGKVYTPAGTGPAYVGPKLTGGDKGLFAGSSTPLGTSIAGTKTNKGAVVGAALLVSSLPVKAGSVPAVLGAKVLAKVVSRYAIPAARVTGNATWGAAAKGLDAIGGGGRIYKSNTVFGPTLASTKIATPAQTVARVTGLEANAGRITDVAVRGAYRGVANAITKDLKTGTKVLKGSALLGGVYKIKKK